MKRFITRDPYSLRRVLALYQRFNEAGDFTRRLLRKFVPTAYALHRGRGHISAVVCVALVIVILTGYGATAQTPDPGMHNFVASGAYTPGQFTDVHETSWYSRYIGIAYDYGLFRGRTENNFDPGGLLTLAEAVILAARLRSIFHTADVSFTVTFPFYRAYVNYAIRHGIITEYADYSVPVTRAQFAAMMHRALPADVFPQINTIADFGIPDVSPHQLYGSSVYALYRAGVLSGSDRFGTFFPYSNISRAESSAILVRVVDVNSRIQVSLPTAIPAELIFQRSTDASVLIETFDSNGRPVRTASGFFVTKDGLILTNFHVFDFAESATVRLVNETEYTVLGVIAACRIDNLALVVIDTEYSGYSFLTLADSDAVETGNSVYVIGSPMALMNSITNGNVSAMNRVANGRYYIQFSAAISFGSGGSALLNTLGQVIGVSYLSYVDGQNINLAVPINRAAELFVLNEIITLYAARTFDFAQFLADNG